jgi:Ca2+-binding RTX toxin-like protein
MATSGSDVIHGDEADNVIHGLGGNDTLYGDDCNDLLFGGAGNDRLIGGEGVDTMDGGAGWDRVDYSYSSGGWSIDLAADSATSLSGSTVEAIISIERVYGSQGNDRIYGDGLGNDLEGENGHDRIYGRGGGDMLEGENGNDRLDGGSGNDTLVGSDGADTLVGGSGNDVLNGGYLGDTLHGGAGSDLFVFTSTGDSPGYGGDDTGWIDVIQGFDGAGSWIALPGGGTIDQDRIDLSAIDANTSAGAGGNQAFTFHGVQTLAQGLSKGAGALWLSTSGSDTYLNGNTDTDSEIEFVVRIADGSTKASSYAAGFTSGSDFIL